MILFTARDPASGRVIVAPAPTEREAGESLIRKLLEYVAANADATRLDWWEINMGESAR